MIRAKVKRIPNPNPNPNLYQYHTLNQNPNRYPHSNSLLSEILSYGRNCRRSKCRITLIRAYRYQNDNSVIMITK